VTGSPLEPLQHMLISGAIALGAAALVTLSLVMFLRWLGLHWTWTLPGVLLWPLLWSFDEKAAVFASATALFATVTGLADKVLAGETYTEPHYLRQAQRYIGHAVRTLRGARRSVNVMTLSEVMVPDLLERCARSLPTEQEAKRVHDYVDSLSAEQRRGLAGTRDRLAILAESDVSDYLYRDEPTR